METVALKEEYYEKNARTSKILHRYMFTNIHFCLFYTSQLFVHKPYTCITFNESLTDIMLALIIGDWSFYLCTQSKSLLYELAMSGYLVTFQICANLL